IFGREELDIGARWTTPASSTPVYKAMKMYRNYDGNKSAFGGTSVKAAVPNPDNVAAFGAERASDGALTVMVISKYLSGSTPVTLSLANFSAAGTAKRYQLTSSNTITALSDLSFTGSSLATSVPQQSITLFIFPKSQSNNQPPVADATATPVSGNAPLAVAFSAAGSSDPDGSITAYGWNFGDGTTGSGVAPGHTYTSAGTFVATLTVTDNGGATATDTVTVTVSPDPNFVAAPSGLTGSGARGSATLRWTDNANNETGFQIERAPAGTSNFSQVGVVGANVTTFTQTAPKGTYLYRVRAYNAGGTSAYSNTAQVKVR
ncbi:MAG: PKD domain-containing protein, partial [Bryobacteraceae bacterium]